MTIINGGSVKLKRRDSAGQRDYLIESLLGVLDVHVRSRGHLRKATIRAVVAFYQTQHEAQKLREVKKGAKP